MKDYAKINFLRDKKAAQDEAIYLKRLISENLYPEKFFMPLTLQFELTSHCNVHCKHCYNLSGENNSEPDRMTPENWKIFARYLVKHGGIFQCVISGGEPLLLGDDLFEIMNILHDDGTTFLLISNGLLMTPEKVKSFTKYRYKWLQISIDGATRERHDSFRQKIGSFDAAIKAVFMLSSAGIPVMIAHSVTPDNLCELDKMCSLAYELGAAGIILGEIMPSGRTFLNQEILLNHAQRNILYEKINENAAKFSGKLRVQRSSGTKIQLMRSQNSPLTGAIIRPDGNIRLDCVAPFVIGNILDEDFCEVWQKKAPDIWRNQEIINYIDSWDDIDEINHGIKNYFDSDVIL